MLCSHLEYWNMFNSKHVKQTTFPVNMLNLYSFINYDCGNQVLEFQSIASNRIIHLSVSESGGYVPPLRWIIIHRSGGIYMYTPLSPTLSWIIVLVCTTQAE